MATSNLEFEGVYDNSKRYIVHNWSPEDFTQKFGAESTYNDTRLIETRPPYEITIKAGEMREMNQFEAYTFTRHFVNREMQRDSEKLLGKERERKEVAIGNAIAREPFEVKTLTEIGAGTTTPFMDKLRKEIRDEEIAKIENGKTESKKSDVKTSEFSGIENEAI